MPRCKDDVWEHFGVISETNGKQHVFCNYCKFEYKIGNATRLKNHVAKCKAVPKALKQQYAELNQTVKYEIVTEKKRNRASSPESSNNSDDDVKIPLKINRKSKKSRDSSSMSRSIFVSGLPGASSDSKFWVDAVEESNIEPSSDDNLGQEVEYANPKVEPTVESNVANQIKDSPALGLIASAWTDINGKGIVNFSISTPEPIFHKSINLGCEIETGEYLGKNMIEIIEELDNTKFVAIVTDNDNNMRQAWSVVEDKYPHISCVGCVSHSLTMLCGDLLKIGVFKSTMHKVLESIKEIKQDSLLNYFKKAQLEVYGSNKMTLKLPNKSNWTDAILALDSFTSNKDALVLLAKARNVEMDSHIRENILTEELWINIDETVSILRPVSKAQQLSESKHVALSDVAALFYQVSAAIDQHLDSTAFFSFDDMSNIRGIIQKRKEMCMKPIHYAANLLDPRYRGQHIEKEIPAATEFISEYACYVYDRDEKIVSQVLTEIACFKTKTGYFGKSEAIWRPANSLAPSIWWRTFAPAEAISPVAIRLLSIPPSSVDSNRNLPGSTTIME